MLDVPVSGTIPTVTGAGVAVWQGEPSPVAAFDLGGFGPDLSFQPGIPSNAAVAGLEGNVVYVGGDAGAAMILYAEAAPTRNPWGLRVRVLHRPRRPTPPARDLRVLCHELQPRRHRRSPGLAPRPRGRGRSCVCNGCRSQTHRLSSLSVSMGNQLGSSGQSAGLLCSPWCASRRTTSRSPPTTAQETPSRASAPTRSSTSISRDLGRSGCPDMG